MTNDHFTIKGKLSLALLDAFGEVRDYREIDNLIVQVGKNFVASALVAASATPFSYIAVGTSGTLPALGDTALGAEITRVAMSAATTSTNIATMVVTFAAGIGTGALQEAGILNAASVGIMLSHVTFPVINKGASDSLVITWTVTAG